MSGVVSPPSVTAPLDGLLGTCHRYPDRSPILYLGSEHCSLTFRTPAGTEAARRAAAELLRIATEYAAAVEEWAEREAACSCAGCVARAEAPS
jgi:hypothetical protein